MIYNIFQKRRRKSDLLIFALSIPALILFFALKDYWYAPSLNADLSSKINHHLDSITSHKGLLEDTILTMTRLTVDEEVIESLADELGVHNARMFMDSVSAYEIMYSSRINISRGNISLGSGSNTTTRQREQAGPTESLIVSIWCDKNGVITGVQEPFAGNLHTEDSTEVFHQLLSTVPSKWRPPTEKWQRIDTVADELRYQARIDTEKYFSRDIVLSARRSSKNRWISEWRVNANVLPQYKSEGEPRDPINSGLVFAIIIGVLIITFIIVCIVRLIKKAVSLVFCLVVSVLVGYYMTMVLTSTVEVDILLFLFFGLIFLVIWGFLLTGLPIAGLFSLARETFAEKFYTSLRLLKKPWESHFVGRSILSGLALGMTVSIFIPLFYYTCFKLGVDQVFKDVVFSPELYQFVSFKPFVIVSASICFLPFISVSALILVPVLVYKLLPQGIRFVTALIGSMLLSTVFTSIQSDSLVYSVFSGMTMGAVGFMVLYFYDILALFIYYITSSLFVFFPTFEAYPEYAVVFSVLYGGMVLFGVKSYLVAPETVREEHYKPEFLYKLEESKRMKQELEAAKSVQQRLLPARLPAMRNVEIAASCVPAFEVGGDYYDFFQLDRHRLGLLIGDVSGKGISAAFYITLAKGVIVSQIRQAGSPSDIMHRVNSLLYGVMERGKFISMIYGVLDTRTGEFSFANAGHNPLILRKATGGQTEIIPSKGMALGLDAGPMFNQAVTTDSITLQEKDIVVFYTDGVTEAMNSASEEYTEQRLLDCIARAQTSASDIVSALLDSVKDFVGNARQHDDITVVALQALAIQNNSKLMQT